MRSHNSSNGINQSRRQFFKALGGVGIAGTTPMTGLAGAEGNNRIQYVKAYVHEQDDGGHIVERPVYDTMSVHEWNRLEAIQRARNQIQSQIDQFETSELLSPFIKGGRGNREIGVRYTVESFNERVRRPNLTVEVLQQRLPSSVTGVARRLNVGQRVHEFPVKIYPYEVPHLDYYEYKYRPVSAGPEVNNNCTLGTPAIRDYDGHRMVVTAGHCISYGQNHHQPNSSHSNSLIGDTYWKHDNANFDAGVIELESTISIYNYFAGNGGDHDSEGPPIVGKLSWIEIDREVGNTSFQVAKRGRTTGEKTGHITGAGSQWVEIAADRAGGDSGGPYFVESSDGPWSNNAYMVAIHSKQGQTQNHSIGTQMQSIEYTTDVTTYTGI